MGLATKKQWTGSYSGATLDGYDIWDYILDDAPTPRTEMVFLSYEDGSFSMQYENLKYMYNLDIYNLYTPSIYFNEDLDSALSSMICSNASLVDDATGTVDDDYGTSVDETYNLFIYLWDLLFSRASLQGIMNITLLLFWFIFVIALSCVGIIYHVSKENHNYINIEDKGKGFEEEEVFLGVVNEDDEDYQTYQA